MNVFESSFVVNAPLEKVWAFHDDPAALTKVMTGPVRMEMLHIDRPVVAGSTIRIRMHVGPIALPWTIRVREKEAPKFFTDAQVGNEGPFKRWVHTHRFESVSATATRVSDRIEYEAPLGLLGRIGAALFGTLAMTLMFAGRRDATKSLLES
jgi:ligand-binding SRPBCC domain-containing protein